MSILSWFGFVKERPVGVVEWDNVRAELFHGGRWEVDRGGKPDKDFARHLGAVYSDHVVHGGPVDGHYGYAILRDLARTHGGLLTYNPPAVAPPGTVY